MQNATSVTQLTRKDCGVPPTMNANKKKQFSSKYEKKCSGWDQSRVLLRQKLLPEQLSFFVKKNWNDKNILVKCKHYTNWMISLPYDSLNYYIQKTPAYHRKIFRYKNNQKECNYSQYWCWKHEKSNISEKLLMGSFEKL